MQYHQATNAELTQLGLPEVPIVVRTFGSDLIQSWVTSADEIAHQVRYKTRSSELQCEKELSRNGL